MDFSLNPLLIVAGHSEYCDPVVFYWLNILSNAAFLVAAFFAFRYLRARHVKNKPLFALVFLLGLMGIGSTLWHIFPMPLTDAADAVPLSLLLLIAAYVLFQKVVPNKFVVIVALSFIVLSVLLLEPLHFLEGSLIYLIVAAVFGILLYWSKQKYEYLPSWWVWIAVVFVASIVFRTIEAAVCESFGIGTHFLWHALNALAAYLLIRLLAQMELQKRPKQPN